MIFLFWLMDFLCGGRVIVTIFSGSNVNPFSFFFIFYLLQKTRIFYSMAEQLRAYLEENGASITGVTLDDFSDTGRGVKAILPLNAGDVILSIPFDLLWTVDAAFKDPDLGPILLQLDKQLPDDEILAIHLLLIRLRDDSNEKRTLHTRVLPTRYTTSVFFGDELDICKGSSFYEITKQLQQQVKNDFARIHETIFSNHPELFSPAKCSLEEVCLFPIIIVIIIISFGNYLTCLLY